LKRLVGSGGSGKDTVLEDGRLPQALARVPDKRRTLGEVLIKWIEQIQRGR